MLIGLASQKHKWNASERGRDTDQTVQHLEAKHVAHDDVTQNQIRSLLQNCRKTFPAIIRE
jgi:hypothetical protein